jgi:ketosteroid isomerase-like protein
MSKTLRNFPAAVVALTLSLPAAVAQNDPVSIFRQAIDARNRGDIEALMQLFSPDVVREDGSCNPPCIGLDAVRRSFENNIAEHFQATLTAVDGAGDTVTARSDIRSDAFRARGIERRPSSYTIKFKDAKIIRWSSPLPPPSSPNASKP